MLLIMHHVLVGAICYSEHVGVVLAPRLGLVLYLSLDGDGRLRVVVRVCLCVELIVFI